MSEPDEWYPTPEQARREAEFFEIEAELRQDLKSEVEEKLGAIEDLIIKRFGVDSYEWDTFDHWSSRHDFEAEIFDLAAWRANECAGPRPNCFGLWAIGVDL